MLAVVFGPRTMREALDVLPTLAGSQHSQADAVGAPPTVDGGEAVSADCVELRLDYFEEPFDLEALLAARTCPVVLTLRPASQGGFSALPPHQRRNALAEGADLGADYVDIEWDAIESTWLAAVRASGARVLVSRHDFQAMPDLDNDWWPALADTGADIVKVVGTAHDVRDCLRVFRTLRRADRPTVAIAMGAAGLPTRVLALREPACFLSYAAMDAGHGTAPGQVSISDMHTTYRAPRLGTQTAAFGLLGPRAEPSLAALHNGWFEALGIDAVAVPFVAEADAAAIVSAFRELPVSGWHIHGEELQTTVGQALDHLAPSGCRAGKVNAIVMGEEELIGEWVETPAEQFRVWTSREPPDSATQGAAAPKP